MGSRSARWFDMEGIDRALAFLGIAFTVWAWVVAWGVSVIRAEVKNMRQAADETSKNLISHVKQTERRLTLLETEWQWVKGWMRDNGRIPKE